MWKVFVDGQAGTTGLRIAQMLSARDDISLITVDPALRKDPKIRKAMLNDADAAFLCLPDEAAREAAAMVENDTVIVIDASTAHRTSTGWDYGFAELSSARRAAIAASKRISVPGCHATGFIALVYPLVRQGVLSPDSLISCHSITGYSGGGSKMIAEYEAPERLPSLNSPRQYALGLTHKHLPEMMKNTGLSHPPVFNPIVCDFFAGMAVSVPLHTTQMQTPMGRGELQAMLEAFYDGQRYVQVRDLPPNGFLSSNEAVGTNELHLYVGGNDEQVTLISVLDNLGKGAAGAAMQCMNIAMGLHETAGF